MTHHDNALHLPRRKRSMRLSLALMGAGAFSLTGCGQPEEVTDVRFDNPRSYQSVDECISANVYTQSACEESYQASLEEVPRFESIEACEAEHGEGACVAPTEEQAQAATGGGGGWFMPAMMGYMVGNMMSRTNRGATSRGLYQEPVYRNRQNQGSWNTATNQASQRINQRQQTMRTTATQNRQSAQRSGFGSRSSARGGWGS